LQQETSHGFLDLHPLFRIINYYEVVFTQKLRDPLKLIPAQPHPFPHVAYRVPLAIA
jgi:hypothetical protein